MEICGSGCYALLYAALGVMVRDEVELVLVIKFRIMVRFCGSFPGKFGDKSLASSA